MKNFPEHILVLLAGRDRHRNRAHRDRQAGRGGTEARGDRPTGKAFQFCPFLDLIQSFQHEKNERFFIIFDEVH